MKLTAVAKPEYLLRPSQVLRRLAANLTPSRTSLACELPWGSTVRVDAADNIGRCVIHSGVYELEVCGAIFRLCTLGETAVDAGANIGVMTAAMAKAVGPSGRVVAFEPSPKVFTRLTENCRQWDCQHAKVELHARALSSENGTATLYVPTLDVRNHGLASMLNRRLFSTEEVTVSTGRLDALFKGEQLSLLKIDVEGHEEPLLRGAEGLLASHAIRDVIFENFDHSYPNVAAQLLQSHGYSIFCVSKKLSGPRLVAPQSASMTLIASIDPARVAKKFKRRGWRALRSPRRERDVPSESRVKRRRHAR